MAYFKIDPDISKAKTLHTNFYTDPQFLQISKEKIFSRSWQLIGDKDLVKEPGQMHPFNFLGNFIAEPLLLTVDMHGTRHCLSNVCTHRGNILVNEPCTRANIRCKYHGRLFRLDGAFVSMPEFQEVKNFPAKDDNLPSLNLFRWGKLLFTSLVNESDNNSFFQEMIERVGWMPIDDFVFRPDLSREYQINAHWALYCENYLEGFHIPFVHSDLNAVIDYGNYTTELYRYSVLQLGIAKDGENSFQLPSSSPDSGKAIAAYYFWVFPNLMFNFYPWGLSVNVVKPVSAEKTTISFLAYMWDEFKYNIGAGANLDKVEYEDEEIVQSVQNGIRSRFYEHGRYSVTREQGTHHFHRLIADFMD